ncbi:MAG: LysR family transcriptional regulator [Comamonadaceae bacterium]|nr:MAG: LysR family transcriptional regulator [Comamonadaceae bacterium]
MKTTLEELQAFTAVVDAGTITGAAEHLGQTVSGISRALARLEGKLDTTLLRRTTRRTELTEEGRAFLARSRAILASIDEAEEHMAARRLQPSGVLRVNAATPFMLHVVAPLVPDFRRAFPQIALELDTDELNIDLLARRTDVAIRIGVLRDSSLNARPLATSRLRVLASPGYLAAHGRPRRVQDLAEHTLLGFTQPGALNRWPLRGAHADDWAVTPDITASSGETLRQLALAGAGIACLSDFMTAGDRARGDLVQVLTKDTADVRQPISAVYYRNTQLSSRIACFLDFLVERMAGTLP